MLIDSWEVSKSMYKYIYFFLQKEDHGNVGWKIVWKFWIIKTMSFKKKELNYKEMECKRIEMSSVCFKEQRLLNCYLPP